MIDEHSYVLKLVADPKEGTKSSALLGCGNSLLTEFSMQRK